jgi:hypothetical protein
MPAVVTDLGLLVLSAAIYFGLRYLGDSIADTPFMRVSYTDEEENT